MTHILFISRYYPPEIAVTGICLSKMAERLVKLGHQVTVLTTVPNYPTGIVPAEYRGHLVQRETRNGVQVVRAWSYVAPNKGFARRIFAHLSFGCLAPFLGWKAVGRPDVIIITSPPLFNVIAGRTLSWLKRRPFVIRIADLWPESAVQLGALRNRTLIRLSEWLEWSTYQKSSFVWVVTEGIRDVLLRRGLPPEKLLFLTNGVDCDTFRPQPQDQARAALAWDERFTVLYAGGHGLSHGLTNVLDAAELLLAHKDIRFVFVGDGAEKRDLVAQAQRRGLENVTFLDPQPHERMPQLLAAADVCLVHVRKVPLFQGMLPVKMYEAMACGRPIALAIDGEARQLVAENAGAALHVESENPEALASTVLYLHAHPEEAAQLGQRGRALVEARFDYDRLADVLDAHLTPLFAQKSPSHPAPHTIAEENEAYIQQ